MLDHTSLENDEVHDSICKDTESQCIRLPQPLRTRSLDAALASSSELGHDATRPAAPVTSVGRRTRSGTIIPGTSSAELTAVSNAPPALPRRTRSGTVVPGNVGAFGPALTNNDEPAAPSLPIRRNRSGTVVSNPMGLAPSLPIKSGASSSVAGSTVGTALRTRIRSGSIVVGNTLANLPSQAAGMMRRTRSGTVVHAPSAPASIPGLEPTAEVATNAVPESTASGKPSDVGDEAEDVEMDLLSEPVASDLESVRSERVTLSNSSPGHGPKRDDTINFLDEPMVFSSPTHSSPARSLTTDTNTALNARSSNGLRARAKAAASKAKGFSKALTGKGGARGKGLTGPEAGAAAVARARARAEQKLLEEGLRDAEDSSDDELLLK